MRVTVSSTRVKIQDGFFRTDTEIEQFLFHWTDDDDDDENDLDLHRGGGESTLKHLKEEHKGWGEPQRRSRRVVDQGPVFVELG